MSARFHLLPVLVLVAWGGSGCSQAPPASVLGAGATEAETAAAEETTVSESPAPEAGAAEDGASEAAESGDEAEVSAPEPGAAEPAADPAERDDHTVILIERAEPREPRPRTLYEASAAARATRVETPPARISVTDENLHEFQGEGVTILTAEPGTGDEGAGTSDAAAGSGAGGAGDPAAGAPGDPSTRGAAGASGTAGVETARAGEAYWRARIRDLRLDLREAVDELAELEDRAGTLRRSFYAADDPYVRDGEIKPAWDRTLDRIAETRDAIARQRSELAEALDEGRSAGALPGWLREGIELEPEEHEYPRAPERLHQPGEPEIHDIREPPP